MFLVMLLNQNETHTNSALIASIKAKQLVSSHIEGKAKMSELTNSSLILSLETLPEY